MIFSSLKFLDIEYLNPNEIDALNEEETEEAM